MELLTIQEVAQMMRVSPITIRRHIQSGELKAVRVGRQIRISKQGVNKMVKPIKPKVSKKQPLIKGRPLTFDDPLWRLVGAARSAKPTDSSKKHEYLAEASLYSGKV